MNKILIFAGTSEGRELSELLSVSKIHHTVCVATSYGQDLIEGSPYSEVLAGRMESDEMARFFDEHVFSLIIDATHPYAYEVTENIKKAIENRNITYIRLKRDGLGSPDDENVFTFDDNEGCIEALKCTEGNILLTTGSKELSLYASEPSIKDRLFVRIIPGEESIGICNEQGISGRNIIAMQGPFSLKMNEAIIDQFSIKHLVTKQSGKSGGFNEKYESAVNKGISLYVIGCREHESGLSFDETVREIEKTAKVNINGSSFDISLIGAGMGDERCLTSEAARTIDAADIIIGDNRLTSKYENSCREVHNYYLAKDIIPLLYDIRDKNRYKKKKIVALFSGDASFYSGGTSLYRELIKEKETGDLNMDIKILPGISSVSYLASKLGVSYSDAYICSMHGRRLTGISSIVRHNNKVFILLSGKVDVRKLGEKIASKDSGNIKVFIGSNLSSTDEKIYTLAPSECLSFDEEGIFTCLIINDHPDSLSITHGLNDDEFIRESVPMTKEEIREVSISKLHLNSNSILFDIGSGSGSITVECARLSKDLAVYAIECKEDAFELTRKNAEKHDLDNIEFVYGKAPEAFEGLPSPTHAFIGGSGGNMTEILDSLYAMNDSMRVVINAVSIDTISMLGTLPDRFSITDYELVQIQVSKTYDAAGHLMMKAANPIWICSFDFCGKE